MGSVYGVDQYVYTRMHSVLVNVSVFFIFPERFVVNLYFASTQIYMFYWRSYMVNTLYVYSIMCVSCLSV